MCCVVLETVSRPSRPDGNHLWTPHLARAAHGSTWSKESPSAVTSILISEKDDELTM